MDLLAVMMRSPQLDKGLRDIDEQAVNMNSGYGSRFSRVVGFF